MPSLKTFGEGSSKAKFAKFRPDKNNRVKSRVSIYVAKLETGNGKIHEYKLDQAMYKHSRDSIGKNCQVTWSYFDLKSIQCGISSR